MAYIDELRYLLEQERRRPRGLEQDEPGLLSNRPTYGDPFGTDPGTLADPMGYFQQGAAGGPAGPQGRALTQKIEAPLPNKSSLLDNLMGGIMGFMQMGGGGAGAAGGGGIAGVPDVGGAEGGMLGGQMLNAGGATGGGPASYPPDLGTFEADKLGPTTQDILNPGIPGMRAEAMPSASPTGPAGYQEAINRLVTGRSPVEYFAKQLGATPAQQRAARAISEIVMTRRKKGQAGSNIGRIAAFL